MDGTRDPLQQMGWQYDGVTSRKLLDRLQGGVPILDADGNPWEFHQFVSAFHLPHEVTGELWDATGASSKPQPELTDAELKRVNAALTAGFREFAKQVRPLSKALNTAGKAAPPSERETFEDALALGYDREQLAPLWDAEAGDWGPLLWLASVQRDLESPAASINRTTTSGGG